MQSGTGNPVFLSTLPPERRERRLALGVIIVSAATFLCSAPFAKVPVGHVPAFIPIYQSALTVNDFVTAIILLGQFAILRSRRLAILASAYFFTACMAMIHLTSFPGLFSPTGLLGAGPQTTAWLYMFWHGGFPLLVAVYAVLPNATVRVSPRIAILCVIIGAAGAAAGCTVLTTAGQHVLPSLMDGTHYTSLMIKAIATVWSLSLLALGMLWRRRPHSILDLWLMVVMCAWLFGIGQGFLNAGRFDLAWYWARIYDLLASCFVLAVLLLENGKLYFQLDRQNRSLEETVLERTERLLQSEKVATMGSLLAGVAHELNNPLAVVLGQCHLLRETAADPKTAERAEKISAAADRCRRIVKNFLSLARQQAKERNVISLNQAVTDAVELLAYELRTDNVEVSLALDEDLPVLWADGHQLHQVLVNIVANAHQAMRRQPEPRQISITTRSNPSRDQVYLAITDSGPGIPPEIRARIFEPFFTTKPAGEGTGLGLSLCRGIIEEHGGSITVESDPGRGTTFQLALPVLRGPAVEATRDAEEAPAPAGSKTILVVDDETEIATVLVEAFERDGYRAEASPNGADALRRLERTRYDIVVSDTKMPVMDGMDLYREIAHRFPALRRRVIFVTGDVLDAEKRRFLESSGAPFLAKPFDLGEVRRMVRRLLVA